VLIGMPEVFLRMKIGSENTLEELETVFNSIANKIHRKEIVANPGLAA